MINNKKIILALDEIQNLEEAIALVKKVGHLVYAVKIHNLYDKFGPDVVRILKKPARKKFGLILSFMIFQILVNFAPKALPRT